MFELEYIKMTAPTVSQYERSMGNSTEADDTILLKGFASTDLLDREKDFVDPTSFDIPTFLNTPTLYLNHKPIMDAYGNDHEAGVIRAAVPSYISEEASEKEWIVRSIETNEYVSHWPKSKAPNMVVGDRGLFVLAEVTHPMAKAKVRNGVVGGFSWRGYTQQVQHPNGVTELKAIDLVEISIVDTPCQPQSTHMVTDKEDDFVKEISLKGYEVVSVNFSPEDMNLSSAIEQVKSFNMENTTTISNKNGFTVSKKGLITQDLLFSVKLSDKTVTLAPKTEHSHPQASELEANKETLTKEFCMSTKNLDSSNEGQNEAVKLFLLDQEAILARIPNVQISHAKSTKIDGVDVDMHTLVIPSEEPKVDISEASKSEVEEIAETEEVKSEVEAVEEAIEVEAEEKPEVEAEISTEEEAEEVAEAVAEEVVEAEAEVEVEAEVKEEIQPEAEEAEKSEEVAEVEEEAKAEVEAEVETEVVAEIEADDKEVVAEIEEVKSEEAPVVEAEAVEAEVEAVEEVKDEVEAEAVSEEAPAEEMTEEVAQVVEEVVAEKSEFEILKSIVMELNLKVKSVEEENEKLRSEISEKTEKAAIAEKQAKELSEQKEELDRLANLFSTTTPSEDSEIVEESVKSTPAFSKSNVVNSLFQIKQGN